MKILLVEDNISIKNGLEFSFKENNYEFEQFRKMTILVVICL